MSTIQRSVHIDPVEPSPLSLRVPSGMETILALTYYRLGALLGDDVGAQLELTGRSNGTRRQFYPVLATDVVNGMARALIPAGDLSDPNGYRLNLYGTVDGQPALLAIGKIDMLAAAGPEAVPADLIDQIDIAFERGEDVLIDVTLWADGAGDAPYDLTSTTISATVYETQGGAALMPFAVAALDTNKVRLSLTVDQVNTLPDSCWWSLVAATAGGATTLCEGKVTVSGVVIPPLTTVVLNFDYQKPDSADPASGQIIHGNWTQSVLKISTTTSDVTDALPTLQLLRIGDQIIVGATTWSVQYIVPGVFWEIGVAPVQQAAVLGITPVTFTRPVT
jgi:hypothetical protein